MRTVLDGLLSKYSVPVDHTGKDAIYVRWSTDDQGQGHTLQIQLEKCVLTFLSRGYGVNPELVFVDDGWSGSNLDRPGLNQIRALVDDHAIRSVMIYKLDRLSRRLTDTVSLICDEWVNICDVYSTLESFDTATPAGKMFLQLLAMFAEFEWETIRVRTLSGKRKNAEAGKNPGYTPPFGYCQDNDSNFLIMSEEAKIVEYIFEQCIKGNGYAAIADALNKSGVKFRNGTSWNASTIGYILKNKTYAGIMAYGKKSVNCKRKRNPNEPYWQKNTDYIETDKNVPIIVTIEVFDSAQLAKAGRSVHFSGVSGRTLSSPHLLTGIAYCKCGHRIAGKNKGSGSKSYYKCRGALDKGSTFCDAAYIPQKLIDDEVIARLKQDLLDVDHKKIFLQILLKSNNAAVNIQQNAIAGLKAELTTIDANIGKVDADYFSQKIDDQDYNRLVRAAKSRRITVQRQLMDAQEQLDVMSANVSNTQAIEMTVERFAEFDNLDIGEKKAILRELLNKVTVYYADKALVIDILTKYPQP